MKFLSTAALIATSLAALAAEKGTVHGKVLDLAGKPVAGATVAVQDKDGKVIAWAKTDANGDYAIAADPMDALHLKPSRRKGLLEKIIDSAADVAMLPVKAAAGAVANPGKTVGSAAESVASGDPTPLGKQIVSSAIPKADPKEAAKEARAAAARAAFGPGVSSFPGSVGDKGEAHVIVSMPGYKEARVTTGAYWMDEAAKGELDAWLEPVKIAPQSDKASGAVEQQALTLSSALAEPTLVPAGGSVKITVTLNVPAGVSPDQKVRIFAREAKKDTVIELQPQGKNVYSGEMKIDSKMPVGPTTISIGGVRTQPIGVNLNPKKADPMAEFVRRLPEMEPGKPYGYDPRIMGCENRLDVAVTVLKPEKKGEAD